MSFRYLMPLLLVPAALAQPAASSLSGFVQEPNGQRVPRASIRVTNAAGVLTSDSGEFTVNLPPNLGPGDPVIFYVEGWTILDPYVGKPGRLFLPKQRLEGLEIRVAKRGQVQSLGAAFTGKLIQDFGYSRYSLQSDLVPEEGFTAFSQRKSRDLGVQVGQLSSAIREFEKAGSTPYSKALAALAGEKFEEASERMRESLSHPEGQEVAKYTCLAFAEYKRGKVAEAEQALRKAVSLRPADPILLNNLGVALVKSKDKEKMAEAEPLLRRALELDIKTAGAQSLEVATVQWNLFDILTRQGRSKDARMVHQDATETMKRLKLPVAGRVIVMLDPRRPGR